MDKRIAITGGIGSGKSYVLQTLDKLGFATFSCDEIYKDVIKDAKYTQKIAEIFPVVVENGSINRKKLAEIVFNDEKCRKKLNDIAHPFIMSRLYALMDDTKSALKFAEVPLLFEGGFEKDFDGIIVVQRAENDRIQAVCARDGLTQKEVESRIKSQIAINNWLQTKQTVPVWIIDNDKDKKALEENIAQTLLQIQKRLS